VLDGRHFLTATTGLAATLAFRSPLLAQLEKAAVNLPDHSPLDKSEDAYGAELRQQLLIPADEIYLNNGIVGSSPAPVRVDLENGLGETHKIRIRGGDPNKLRLSTPHHLQKKDIDRFLEKFDEYKHEKKLL
jgi:hypothetical protein